MGEGFFYLRHEDPTLRQIATGTGVSTKDLLGAAKQVAKIAGLGKPEVCVEKYKNLSGFMS